MRYAIFSDVHGNLEALTAVLEHLAEGRIDRLLCLGDSIGYGADPAACLERLTSSGAMSVAGNHEWGCLGKLDVQWFNAAARQAILWTRDQLGFAELEALRRLPLTLTDGPVTLVHGTLTHPERFEYLMDLGQGMDTASHCRTPFCAMGHTHVPCVLEYDLQARRMRRVVTSPAELSEVRLERDGSRTRYLINPGSVGQPRDGDPRASLAILDTDACHVSVARVPYDIPRAQEKIRRANLPEFLADRLALGR